MYLINDLSKLVVSPNDSLHTVIELMNSNGYQFAVVARDNKIVGVVTDGDVRRSLLLGVQLEQDIELVMNTSPKLGRAGDNSEVLKDFMDFNDINYLPIVTGNGSLTGILVSKDKSFRERIQDPVVIMAGGKGTRLHPLTLETPKPMIEVGGKPILEHILRKLRKQGFNRVHISVNYLAEVIETFVGDGSKFGLEVTYLYEDSPLGTAGALSGLKNKGLQGNFIVMNADLITEVDLSQLLDYHDTNDFMATIGVREYVHQVPFGVVEISDQKVSALVEKPLQSSLVSAGIYAFKTETLEFINENSYLDMPSLLNNLLSLDYSMGAFLIHENWTDVGRPEDLAQARQDQSQANRPMES